MSCALQGSPASVMECVPGGSLRAGLQALAAQGGVPERLRVATALQAARGAFLALRLGSGLWLRMGSVRQIRYGLPHSLPAGAGGRSHKRLMIHMLFLYTFTVQLSM